VTFKYLYFSRTSPQTHTLLAERSSCRASLFWGLRELKAAHHLYCFEADGLALTQSSARGKIPEDGKWMSGRMIVRTIKKD